MIYYPYGYANQKFGERITALKLITFFRDSGQLIFHQWTKLLLQIMDITVKDIEGVKNETAE